MGEWSDYFEDFPEENPGNYDANGNFDPNGVNRREGQLQDFAQKRLDEIMRKKGSSKTPPNK